MNFDSIACPGYRMSRRAFTGAAAGLFLGMNVRTLVARSGEDHKSTAEHVILFWNGGGMSHIDTFDPKPGRATQGEFEPIKTSVNGRHDLGDLPALGQADEARRLDPLDRRTKRRPRPGHVSTSDQLRPERQPAAPGRRLGGGQRADNARATCPHTSPSAAWPRRPATWDRSAKPISSADPARRILTWHSLRGSARSAATNGSTSCKKINQKQADNHPSR